MPHRGLFAGSRASYAFRSFRSEVLIPPFQVTVVSASELTLPEDSSPDVLTPARVAKGRIFLGLLLLLVLIPVGYGARDGWLWYRTRSFRVGCETSRGQKDWRSERTIAERWVAWDPETDRGWWYAAEAAQNLNDLPGMARYLGSVPRSDPKALLAYVEKVNLEWTALNKPLDAVKTSELILSIDPEVVEVHSRLISFYAMSLQRVQLLKAIRHAMQHHSESREVFVYFILADLLSFTNGADLNSRWLASSPDEPRFKVGLGVHTAMSFAMNVDTSRTEETVELDREAGRQLEFFLKELPSDPILLTHMMHRAYQAGDAARVGELLQKVGAEAVEDHMIWVYRAWYHTAFNEFEPAEQAIREALRLHPVSPLAHHEYANLLRKQGRIDAATAEQKLAGTGRELRTRLLHIPRADAVEADVLVPIARYLKECGDLTAYNALQDKLRDFGFSAEAEGVPPSP